MDITTKFNLEDTFYMIILNDLNKSYDIKEYVVDKIEIYLKEAAPVISYRPKGISGTLSVPYDEDKTYTWTEALAELATLKE